MKMLSNHRRLAAALVVTALVAGGVGAAAVGLTRGSSHSTVTIQQPSSSVANVSAGQLTVGEIAERYSKGVVEVVSTEAGNTSPYPYGSRGSSRAEGTGFVYDTDGHIVTNEHVIDGASSVKVTFADGSSYTATVVGKDISTDLALLKVNAPSSKLTRLALADSSSVSIGEGVVAIGDPFGLEGTVTSGIVSAVGREISAPDDTPIEGAIQTDAAINHGNSGGPLFDLTGKVIGVTSQIESDSGGSDGVGFAIPSNTVKSVVAQLLSGGTVEHAFLGVGPQTVAGTGVRVTSVASGSAADKAGVKSGDVITSVNGIATRTAAALRAVIAEHKPGDELTLSVVRSGATRTISVTLGTRSS
jgi:putative serine protease PepD